MASRGALCHLTLPARPEELERAPAALALVRDSLGVVHVPPGLLQAAVALTGLRARAAVLRADLGSDRAQTALAVGDLLGRGLAVAVVKRPLAWVPARRALFGALPSGAAGSLPARTLRRLGVAPTTRVAT